MSDRKIDITRRKVLGALGTVGAVGLGAGFGTSALFSDTEGFVGNTLAAGDLDLLVDWEEHYYRGTNGSEYVELADPETADYVLPAMEDGKTVNLDADSIALNFVNDPNLDDNVTAKDLFWDATAIEAFPDENNDGQQDDFNGEDPCTYLTDAEPALDSPNRTMGSAEQPLVQLDDVKPGDFGEVTFSFHLCGNPGLVWLAGALDEERTSENGVTEPENDDPDEDYPEGDEVELLDEVMTRFWYDPNCDNQNDQKADIMLAFDISGSIGGDEAATLEAAAQDLKNAIDDKSGLQIGQLVFGEEDGDGDWQVNNFRQLQDPGSLTIDVQPGNNGGTPFPQVLDIADQELRNGTNARDDAEKVIVVFTDGGPNYQNRVHSAGGYDAPRSPAFTQDGTDLDYDGAMPNGAVDPSEQAETATVAQKVRDGGTRIATVNVGDDPQAELAGGTPLDDYLREEIASPTDYYELELANLEDTVTSLAALLSFPEEVFFVGTLRDALSDLSSGEGIPLDGQLTPPRPDGEEPARERACFAGGGVTHCVGFQWWLPINHANEVQSDRVAFDIGFYTEQCRHNGTSTPPLGST
jgi:hypothetical protein